MAGTSTKVCKADTYGADPSGVRDSLAGIQAAIDDCSTQAGAEVELSSGTYALLGGANLLIAGRYGPTITGAGQQATRIVQHGRNDVFGIRTDGTTVENLALDTGTYNPGVPPNHNDPAPPVLYAHASHLLITDITGVAGTGFGMRFVGAQPCDAYSSTNNTVSNVTMTNQGVGGYSAIDMSCQNGSSVSNVTVHGNTVTLYRDTHTSLYGERYTPGPNNRTCAAPWYITGPASNLTVAQVSSSGGAGIIAGTTNNIQILSQSLTNQSCT